MSGANLIQLERIKQSYTLIAAVVVVVLTIAVTTKIITMMMMTYRTNKN
jgi:hypothetical protein